MTLGEWLRQQDMSQRILAEKLGLTQGRISQIVRGGTDSIALARRIEVITEGLVTLNDLSITS